MSLSLYLEGAWLFTRLIHLNYMYDLISIFDLVNCGAPDINAAAMHYMVFHPLQADGKNKISLSHLITIGEHLASGHT